jgi:hypothetical protein
MLLYEVTRSIHQARVLTHLLLYPFDAIGCFVSVSLSLSNQHLADQFHALEKHVEEQSKYADLGSGAGGKSS